MGETSTATLVYLPEYASRTMGAERIHVDLGNNGRLRVSPPKKDVTTVENPSTSINGQTVTVGSVLRYEVSWTNTASTVANDVSITDVAPTGTQYVLGEDGQPVTTGEVVVLPNAGSDPVDATPALRGITATLGDDGILTWNAGDVQPGETVQVSFQVRVTSESVTTVDNQASLAVGPNTYDTNWVHNPVPVKDVSFAEEPTTSINGQTVGVGSTPRYKVAWTNGAETAADDVSVYDYAPAGTEYLMKDGAPVASGAVVRIAEDGTVTPVREGIAAVLDGEKITWQVGTVQPGETVLVTFDVTVLQSAVELDDIENQATLVVGPNEFLTNWVHNPVPDPKKDVTTVEDPTISINGQSVGVGSTLRYEVSWTNGSAFVAEDVKITDAAPDGTAYMGADEEGAVPGRPEGTVTAADGTERAVEGVHQNVDGTDSIVWNAGDVQPGETVHVSFQVRVSGESVSVVDNQATMTVGRNDHSTNWVHNPVEVLEGSDTVTLQLEKTLRGRPMEEGEFGFVATDTATGEQMTALAPAAPDGVAASVTFKPIVYTSGSSMEGAELQPDGSLVKRFVYAISEVNGGVDGVLYDPATFYAVVNVTDDQRGTVTAEGPVYCYDADGAQPIEGLPSYINRYSDGLPFVPGSYKITEATEGHDPSGLSFGFAVTDNNGGANQGQIVAIGTAPANGPVTFSTMEFFEPGIYNYVIRELRGGTGGSISYDGASFGLQVVHQEPARRPGQRPGADPRRVRLCDHRRRHRRGRGRGLQRRRRQCGPEHAGLQLPHGRGACGREPHAGGGGHRAGRDACGVRGARRGREARRARRPCGGGEPCAWRGGEPRGSRTGAVCGAWTARGAGRRGRRERAFGACGAGRAGGPAARGDAARGVRRRR